jgi:hypothetical protein
VPMKKSDLGPASDILRVDYKAITRADPALAWRLFADWREWDKFTDLYGDLRWTHGAPWSVGSRLRMEVVRPARFTVNRVITMCRPGECVAWVDHSRGSTVEQWVTFELQPDGLTCVRVLSQGIGSKPKVAGQPFAEFLKNSVKRWLDGFCKECDHLQAAG